MASWIQARGEDETRIEIPRTKTPQQNWSVETSYVNFEGRSLPVAARGQHITNEWSLDTVWNSSERGQVEEFITLLRDVALSPDGRLDVHIAATEGGTDIDFVAVCPVVPQMLAPGKTELSIVLREVDV